MVVEQHSQTNNATGNEPDKHVTIDQRSAARRLETRLNCDSSVWSNLEVSIIYRPNQWVPSSTPTVATNLENKIREMFIGTYAYDDSPSDKTNFIQRITVAGVIQLTSIQPALNPLLHNRLHMQAISLQDAEGRFQW
jgi:hypothetical protein